GRHALRALGVTGCDEPKPLTDFDVVLMDVQMPEMDGLEATAAIRRHERAAGGHVPVIAMTAFAMKGDRERCLESGMDGYVSKPVRVRDLFDAVGRAVGQSGVCSPESGARKEKEASSPAPDSGLQTPVSPGLDWNAALEYVGGDRKLLADLIGLFLPEYPAWLADARRATASGDVVLLRRAAHNLKGSLGHFGAESAFET